MVKERIWFENFVSSAGEVFLAGKDSKLKSYGIDFNVKRNAKPVHLNSNPGSADTPLDEIDSKIGRPLGSTKEGSEELNQKRILEIEQDLLNRGIRRSERLKEMKNANIVEIPKDYFEAQSNPNWPNWEN
ncbi:hypothetical protein AVEN_232404-1 [Araneus ventricosus]|uniref:Uncharacterized protein n=1 Tax=Araneus ventricosus TaxID=182803 RepID=A0A4Y2CU25_ARAVE|nr:hypothetical protein AVEN_232404-1 [Araneus ventricosus]